jgi:ATP-dependent DNA helicase RecQ
VCDNCLAHTDSTARLPTEEETVAIQKALSCVARVDGRYGRGRIAQTLVGSRSKQVLDIGLDRLSTYGLLREFGEDYIWNLLDALLRAGCLALSSGEYPTLSLTPLGREVMLRKRAVALVLPTRSVTAPKSPRALGKTPRKQSEAEGLPYDEQLFDTLRDWRRQKAAALGNVPAYLIYPDKTLKELARLKPKTVEELLEVRGIGEAKAQRFGAETLALIHPHGAEHE